MSNLQGLFGSFRAWVTTVALLVLAGLITYGIVALYDHTHGDSLSACRVFSLDSEGREVLFHLVRTNHCGIVRVREDIGTVDENGIYDFLVDYREVSEEP